MGSDGRRCAQQEQLDGAVQVESNLQEQLGDHLHFRKLKCC